MMSRESGMRAVVCVWSNVLYFTLHGGTAACSALPRTCYPAWLICHTHAQCAHRYKVESAKAALHALQARHEVTHRLLQLKRLLAHLFVLRCQRIVHLIHQLL